MSILPTLDPSVRADAEAALGYALPDPRTPGFQPALDALEAQTPDVYGRLIRLFAVPELTGPAAKPGASTGWVARLRALPWWRRPVLGGQPVLDRRRIGVLAVLVAATLGAPVVQRWNAATPVITGAASPAVPESALRTPPARAPSAPVPAASTTVQPATAPARARVTSQVATGIVASLARRALQAGVWAAGTPVGQAQAPTPAAAKKVGRTPAAPAPEAPATQTRRRQTARPAVPARTTTPPAPSPAPVRLQVATAAVRPAVPRASGWAADPPPVGRPAAPNTPPPAQPNSPAPAAPPQADPATASAPLVVYNQGEVQVAQTTQSAGLTTFVAGPTKSAPAGSGLVPSSGGLTLYQVTPSTGDAR